MATVWAANGMPRQKAEQEIILSRALPLSTPTRSSSTRRRTALPPRLPAKIAGDAESVYTLKIERSARSAA